MVPRFRPAVTCCSENISSLIFSTDLLHHRLDEGTEPSFICERVCTSDRLMRRMGGLAKVSSTDADHPTPEEANPPPSPPLCQCSTLHAFSLRRTPPPTHASQYVESQVRRYARFFSSWFVQALEGAQRQCPRLTCFLALHDVQHWMRARMPASRRYAPRCIRCQRGTRRASRDVARNVREAGQGRASYRQAHTVSRGMASVLALNVRSGLSKGLDTD